MNEKELKNLIWEACGCPGKGDDDEVDADNLSLYDILYWVQDKNIFYSPAGDCFVYYDQLSCKMVFVCHWFLHSYRGGENLNYELEGFLCDQNLESMEILLKLVNGTWGKND